MTVPILPGTTHVVGRVCDNQPSVGKWETLPGEGSTNIKLFHFAPQNDTDLVSWAIQGDANVQNEEGYLVPDSHRTKGKTVIEGIGHVSSMSNVVVVKVCANFCAIMHAIVDIEQGKPFLYLFMVKMIHVIQHPDFQRWRVNNKKNLEHLHFNFMQKLIRFSLNLHPSPRTRRILMQSSIMVNALNFTSIKLASTYFEKMQENIDNE